MKQLPSFGRRTAQVLLFALALLAPISAGAQTPPLSAAVAPANAPAFKSYWYGGKAELNRFELHQNRYGEVRDGNAVLIFVTEDFLPETQVKYEGRPAPDKPVSVLKLNAVRKFVTGIYPYSTMTSVFTPVDPKLEHSYKVTTSSQEWCGHVFMQLNHRGKGYKGQYFSYFQGEGDRSFELPDALLEDEIWTRIRLNPAALPQGEIEVIPGTLFLRLMHKEIAPQKATATLEDTNDASLSSKPLKTYKLKYSDLARTLSITFDSGFPYSILAWEETTAPLGGKDGVETTRAVKTHTMMLDYWNHHDNADAHYREELGLDQVPLR